MLVKPIQCYRNKEDDILESGSWSNKCLHNGYETLVLDHMDVILAEQLVTGDYGLVARVGHTGHPGDSFQIDVDLSDHSGADVYMTYADTIQCRGGVIFPTVLLVDGNNQFSIPVNEGGITLHLMIITYSHCTFKLLFNDIQFNKI